MLSPRLLVTALALPLLALAAPQAANNPVTLLPANLPACAQACTVLLQAQAACVPPAAPATGVASYQSCFCQSAYLTPLRAGTPTVQNLCTGQCQDSDFGAIAGWYIGYCKSPPSAAGGTATTAPAAGGTPTPASPSADAAGQYTGGAQAAPTGPGWFSTHWRWILMLIILLLAFTAAGIAGTIYRRRYLRRKEAQAFAAGGSEHSLDRPVGGAGPTGRGLPPANGRAHAELGMWAQGMSSVHDVREVPTAYYLDEKMLDKGAAAGRASPEDAMPHAGEKEIEVVHTDAVAADDGGALGQRRHGLGSKLMKKR